MPHDVFLLMDRRGNARQQNNKSRLRITHGKSPIPCWANWGFLFVPCHEINPWEHFNQIKDDNLKMMTF